jgi:hypothetical protein
MKTTLAVLLLTLLGTLPQTAAAEREQLVDGGRIYLGEVVADLAPSAATLDLGPAPKAGSSRLLSAEDLNRALKAAGTTLVVKDSVRVVRSTKHWNQQDLTSWISPAISKALPDYATLVRLEVPRSLLTPTTTVVGHVELAQLPKRRGTLHTSVVVDLMVDGELEQRLSLPVVLELGDRPTPLTVPRGQTVTVSINLGLARVSATAVTLQAVEVGTVALCRVLQTKKVLRARLISKNTAEVVTE